ncbi:GNAT family N-acetyltransferase [Microbacterium sp.]|uniref:GNAT family N-acetyltransferase n=1 Tax=Microbacterium sp. TaxID=51671 RepID=UPI003F728491
MSVPQDPPLLTERLRLRRPVPSDATVYHRMWMERDPRVPAHRRLDSDGRPTVDDISRDLIAGESALESRHTGLLSIEIVETREVIGYCGLVGERAAGHMPELAFELLARFQGRGYATEAAEATIAWARACGIARLQATVWDWNTASRRVLEKLGFHDTGRVDKTLGDASSLVTELDLESQRE